MTSPEGASGRSTRSGVLGLAVLVYVVALGTRLPIMLTRPVDGDEAIQGIAAQRVLDGHWTWYFPGQKYGGTLETIPQALFQALDEGSTFLLRLPLVLIAAGTVLLLAFLALELTRSRLTFAAVGLLAALFPPLYVFLGSWQTAGYNSSTFLGVTAVYLVARALRPDASERRRLLLAAGAGLSAGVALYQQPLAGFAIAALGTTVLVATWPRALALARLRYLAAFAMLGLVGVSPEIVAVTGGLGIDTANNPLPPGYQLTPALLATVAGLDVFGTTPEGIFPGGPESMTWNVLGLQFLDDLLVSKWLGIALAAAAWVWALATVARDGVGRRGDAPGERDPARLRLAVAAGALAAGIVVAIAAFKLPPFAKYAYGLCGFAAFGLAVLVTRGGIPGRAAAALAALGVAALVGISAANTFHIYEKEHGGDLREQRSWLLSRIGGLPPEPDGEATRIWGDYWIVYPLEFLSGGRAEGVAAAFNRFEDREPPGEMPDGRVIVPLVPELPFREQVDAMLRDRCKVESSESHAGATLLIARCLPRDDPEGS
jgi:hypothetical protein